MNRPLLLDACVTINLLAAAPIDHVARQSGYTFLITRQAAGEVGYLREVKDGQIAVVPVDLRRRVIADAFEIIELTQTEIPLYVELAGLVDDGEASTIAVAFHRILPIATDDRKARRVCAARGLPEPLGTVGILRQYCEAQTMRPEEITVTLRKVSRSASFQPPRSDPDLKWWMDRI